MGRLFVDGHAKGVRWNDPAFAINWPAVPAVISPRDRDFPDYL
jgi:dTDP-4-dehydrorhamnose 3,5-epimerase